MRPEVYNGILVRCRAKALGAPHPDLVMVRDRQFHADMLAENAIRFMVRRIAERQQRSLRRVIVPRHPVEMEFAQPRTPGKPGARGRRRRK